MIGRWLEMLALALFAYQLTHSAFIVAMLTMLRLLPMALFGAFLGAAADRFDHRRALILMVLGALAPTLALGVLATVAPESIRIWHLAVVSFINGICWAADNPVRRMMIGGAVGNERMASAMSFDIGTNNFSRIIGPTTSGFLFAHFGIASIFWFNTALYVIGLVAALRVTTPKRVSASMPGSFLSSVRDGFAWLHRNPNLIGVFAITAIFNIFGWPFTSMIPVVGTDYLHLGPSGVGLLASFEGIGGLTGALVIAAVARPTRYGYLYIGAVSLYFAAVVAFVTAPIPPLAAAALFLAGFFSAGFASMQGTLVYRGAPVEMRARLLGVLSVAIGMGPLGFLYLGFLADVLTPRYGTIVLAVQGIIALALTRRYWWGVLRPSVSPARGA
jgi:predicted MFS family arabinose efflux permease